MFKKGEIMQDIHYGRKRNGIKRELDNFIVDWLSTIDNEAVRHRAEKNVIITGGCIASMLLGEKINDFDVYFRDQTTTKMIAEYYCEKFRSLNADKLIAKGTAPFTPEVRVEWIENCKGVAEARVVIYIKSAGVAGENMEQYKYFEGFSGEEAEKFAESLAGDLKEEKPKYRPIFLSQNAITLSNNAQIVIRFYGEPAELHDNYDFVHAMSYYDYENNNLVFPPEAMEAMLSRTLVYKGSLYPIASIFRAKKFIERGWRITAGQLLKIMWQISELDLKDYKILREQLTGVDQAYMYQLINALQDVDPNKINSAYIATIIDRIFE